MITVRRGGSTDVLTTLLAVAGIMFGVLAATPAGAVRIPVVPTKLIVVDKLAAATKAKVVFVAKDGAVTKGGGTSVESINTRFTVAYPSGFPHGEFYCPIGSANGWLVNKDKVAKYVNKDAPNGPTEAKVAVIKPGKLLKIVGKGLGDLPLNILGAGDPGGTVWTNYRVQNAFGDYRHCSGFTGCVWKSIAGGTGAKLVCKDGFGDGTCIATCGDFFEGCSENEDCCGNDCFLGICI